MLIVAGITYSKKLSTTPSIFGNVNFRVFMSSLSYYASLPIAFALFADIRNNPDLLELFDFLKDEIPTIFETKEPKGDVKPEIYDKYSSKSKSIFESLNKIVQEGRKEINKDQEGGKTDEKNNNTELDLQQQNLTERSGGTVEDVEDVEDVKM